MIDTLLHYDRAAGDAAARYRHTAVMKVVGPASDLADQWQLFSLCMGTTVFGIVRRNRQLASTGVEMAAAMLVATGLKNVVKRRIDRTRPLVPADGGKYLFQRGDHDVPELDSFPSGHTAGAVAVARTIARHYPNRQSQAGAVAAALALAQIPRGKHYPTDLMAGLVVGLASAAIVSGGRKMLSRVL